MAGMSAPQAVKAPAVVQAPPPVEAPAVVQPAAVSATTASDQAPTTPTEVRFAAAMLSDIMAGAHKADAPSGLGVGSPDEKPAAEPDHQTKAPAPTVVDRRVHRKEKQVAARVAEPFKRKRHRSASSASMIPTS